MIACVPSGSLLWTIKTQTVEETHQFCPLKFKSSNLNAKIDVLASHGWGFLKSQGGGGGGALGRNLILHQFLRNMALAPREGPPKKEAVLLQLNMRMHTFF